MKVLVACEESQRVAIAFREKGHEAFSCDIEPESGGHPEWHIQADVLPLLDGNCDFVTADGICHTVEGKWDLLIAFPPCTYLTNAGTRHFSLKCNSPDKVAARVEKRNLAAEFFMQFVKADCDRISIENPVGYMNSHFLKASQIIQPYFFGDPYSKRTCLWLKNLPLLIPTKILEKPEPMYICQGPKCKGKKIYWSEGIRGTSNGQFGRAKARSKTFPGIAKAMADQWG